MDAVISKEKSSDQWNFFLPDEELGGPLTSGYKPLGTSNLEGLSSANVAQTLIFRGKNMDMREKLLRPTWIKIDLDAIKHNTAEIKKVIGEGVKLISVLKGNAYGCGLLQVVKTLCCENIYGFGAGNIYEAIEVRRNCNLLVVLFGNTLKTPFLRSLGIILRLLSVI